MSVAIDHPFLPRDGSVVMFMLVSMVVMMAVMIVIVGVLMSVGVE